MATKKKLTKPQKKWLKALRSGKYKQAKGVLSTAGKQQKHCCLGVACDIFKKELKLAISETETHKNVKVLKYDGNFERLPYKVKEHLNLRSDIGSFDFSDVKVKKKKHSSLASINDGSRQDFSAIADIIEQNAELVFK